MKIAVYSAGGVQVASSRLRSHYVFDYIKQKNIQIFRNVNFFKSLNMDVFHFHMLYKPKNIITAIFLRILGKIVIFDVDDNPLKLKHKLGFYLMTNCSTLVFFDTKFRMEYHKKNIINKKKLYQISDTLDYHPLKKIKNKNKKFRNFNKFIWFGHIDNLNSIKKFCNLVNQNKKLSLYILSSFKKNYNVKNIFFLKWHLNYIFKLTEKIDFSVLNHKGNVDTLCKSENKMVLSILAGIVPIVSNTPSYSLLAKELNAEILIYNKVNDIIKIAKKLNPSWKKKFIKKAQKYLISKYSSQEIFKSILKKINSK